MAAGLVPVRRIFGFCSIPPSMEYGALATVDARGFLHPFSKLNFDEPGDWKLAFGSYGGHESKLIIKDKFVLNTLKSIRFSCFDEDKGKPDGAIEVLKDNVIVYRAAYIQSWDNFGIFNHDLRFARVAAPDEAVFRLILDSLPHAPRENVPSEADSGTAH
jgi:hypothetical protein